MSSEGVAYCILQAGKGHSFCILKSSLCLIYHHKEMAHAYFLDKNKNLLYKSSQVINTILHLVYVQW